MNFGLGRGRGRGRGQSQSQGQGRGKGQGKDQGQGRGKGQGKDQGQGRGKGQGQGRGKGQGKGKDNVTGSHKGSKGSGNRDWEPRANTPENRERKFFDKLTKDDSSTICDHEQACRFLVAASAFAQSEGAVALLYRLVETIEKCSSESVLEKALAFVGAGSSRVHVFTDGFLSLLELLSCKDLDKPSCKQPLGEVLSRLYTFQRSFLTDQTIEIIGMHDITREQAMQLNWFYEQVALCSETARNDPRVHGICEILRSKFSCYTAGLQNVLVGRTTLVSIAKRNID
jgi:hypothetical protein